MEQTVETDFFAFSIIIISSVIFIFIPGESQKLKTFKKLEELTSKIEKFSVLHLAGQSMESTIFKQ